MRNFPALIVLLLVFLAVTAFAVSERQSETDPLPASAELLDRLTDEFLYLEQLAATAEERLGNKVQAQLAGNIADIYQEKNRELCDLIIEREIPAKRDLSKAQRKAIATLIPARGDALNHSFENLLRAEFDTLQTLINQHKGLIEERDISDFVEQVLTTQEQLKNKIGILR